MSCGQYIILASSEQGARALSQCVSLIEAKAVAPACVTTLVVSSSELEGLVLEDLVDFLVRSTGCEEPGFSSGDAVVLVDLISPGRMNVVADRPDWSQLIASLILAFPDVRWFFGEIEGTLNDHEKNCRDIFGQHSLEALLFGPRRDPLFDPTGLRQHIRALTNVALLRTQEDGLQVRLPNRRELAGAIDEEHDFSTLHGYAAYKAGYRAEIVNDWETMKYLFCPRGNRQSHGMSVLLEDMRLAFPDKRGAVHISELDGYIDEWGRPNGRAHHCPLLASDRDDSRFRVLVTTGQERAGSNLLEKNADFLRSLQSQTKIVLKPAGGLFSFWASTGIPHGRGFQWPPGEHFLIAGDGHGAPGRLGLIATILLERSRAARRNASSAKAWLRAALLAMESVEYVSGKTPSLALSAIALKHECEVQAECEFLGAGFRIGVESRVAELASEVESASKWFSQDEVLAGLDGRVSILTRLERVFREAGQRDEAGYCQRESRRLNRRLNRPSRPECARQIPRYALSWIPHICLWYGETLLGRFGVLLAATAAWVAVLILAGLLTTGECSIESSVSQVLSAFAGGSPSGRGGIGVHIVLWSAVAVGVYHVGLLISYLYSLIAGR